MFNPCRYYENVFKSVASDFKDNARFIRVDIDKIELREIALQEEVRTFPTVSFYQSGLELVSIIGTNESRLRHFVTQYKPTVNGGEIATKKIRRVKSEDEFLELVQLGRLSVAVFYSKQCLFCQRLMPELEELNTRFYEKLDMVLIDCDERVSINQRPKFWCGRSTPRLGTWAHPMGRRRAGNADVPSLSRRAMLVLLLRTAGRRC